MNDKVIPFGRASLSTRRATHQSVWLRGFTKALAVMKALDSPVVSENKGAVAEWFAEGKLSAEERDAVFKAMGWEAIF